MEHHGGKIAAGLLCLVIVWIIVFWLWTPTEAKISFSTADTAKPELVLDDASARPKLPNVVADPTRPADQTGTRAATPRPAAGGVVAPEFQEYTVQPGETFASIALKFFGSRSRAEIIASANPLVDPTRIKAGRVIRIPRDPSNIQGKPVARPSPAPPSSPTPKSDSPASGSARTHTVEKGDTLTGISQKYYGTIRKVDLILGANRDVLNKAEDLRPGQVLQIPPAPQ
ncbi:MAG: LysM peptidoglycan-binding domain-containing protein [Phycisphaerales bacterium]